MTECKAANPYTCRVHGVPMELSTQQFAAKLAERVEGSSVILHRLGANLTLDLLYLPEELRHQNIGSLYMETITRYADHHKLTIKLDPDDGFGVPKQSLVKFYMKFGFTPKFNVFHDYRILECMIRYPQG